jgi:hypothetical protein
LDILLVAALQGFLPRKGPDATNAYRLQRMVAQQRRPYVLDLLVSLCTLWVACGFFLDAWAHGHVPIETFFTPYHGVFYAGLFALVLVLGAYAAVRRSRGVPWGSVFPRTYRVPLLGIPIFLLSGAGDLLWHHFLGVEVGVDALLSPTHQGLGLGIFFLSSAPIASTLRARARASLVDQLPLILALATWIELVHFGTAYGFDPAAGSTNAPPPLGRYTPEYLTIVTLGYYKLGTGVLVVIFQSALVAGFALFSLRARPQFGFLTLLYLLGNFAAAAAFTNETPLLVTTLLSSFVAGIAGDTLIATTRPAIRVAMLRVFGIAVPALYFATYFVVTAIADRLWWDWNVVLGAICWAGVIGLGLTFLVQREREA